MNTGQEKCLPFEPTKETIPCTKNVKAIMSPTTFSDSKPPER